VTFSIAEPVLPAKSVWLAMNVRAPSEGRSV